MQSHSSKKRRRPVKYVNNAQIRRIFNQRNYYQKVLSGEWKEELLWERHLKRRRPYPDPICTRSQEIAYKAGDKYKAIVHQYMRPDGSIGASGLPDPKRLFLKDHIISVRSRKK